MIDPRGQGVKGNRQASQAHRASEWERKSGGVVDLGRDAPRSRPNRQACCQCYWYTIVQDMFYSLVISKKLFTGQFLEYLIDTSFH